MVLKSGKYESTFMVCDADTNLLHYHLSVCQEVLFQLHNYEDFHLTKEILQEPYSYDKYHHIVHMQFFLMFQHIQMLLNLILNGHLQKNMSYWQSGVASTHHYMFHYAHVQPRRKIYTKT